MPFPESERVVYRNNPLKQVICQLRFPPILRIDAQPPADFQDQLRDGYPNYREVTALPSDVPEQVAAIMRAAARTPRGTAHEFRSSDGAWCVTLSRESLALSTTRYPRWESFSERLARCTNVLRDVYRPASFSRVGLRYVNVIQRTELGIDGKPWSELIQPPMAGEFTDNRIADRIQHATREVSIRLDHRESKVVIRHGIVFSDPGREQCFMIDSDFFVEAPRETDDAEQVLDDFHKRAGHLFRWSISDRLHEALEPGTE